MLGCQSVRLIHLLWSSQTPSGEQEKLTINDALSVSRYSSRRKIEVSAVPDQSSPAHPIEPPASAWPAKRRIAPMAMLSPVSIFSMPALTSSLRSSNGSSPISPFSIKERGLGADVGLSKREKALFASPTQLDIESRSGQVAEIGAPLTPISVDVLKEEQEKKQEMEMETNVNALEVKSAPQYVAHMFKWKQGGNFVKVTGTFDKWERNHRYEEISPQPGPFREYREPRPLPKYSIQVHCRWPVEMHG
ncbi:hypothetical protein BC939DRAFT_441557 [Gamsiella multidivaricata]|uniref:uncharacterized protein n=1 Tax=Gamsiella multidivaricata TaxID=101098 RepID=UPI002220AE61|nr:uncharacterized protein BC939DRAFT_441557 [Gamsiella multidivaricata]KAI7829324.1 hypothetical protein BC939DRAFT_441557 [Gamsiella multidivaricata]